MADQPRPPNSDAFSTGKLTSEDLEKARRWLTAQWTLPNCPFHGPTNWELGDALVATVGFTGTGLQLGGGIYPMLVLVCSQCGHTVFVNAIKAGIISPPPTVPVADDVPSDPPAKSNGDD